jgi:hypothetical protein
MKEHTTRRGNLKALENLRVEQRKRDHLFELLNVIFHSTDVRKVDIGLYSERICICKV